MKPPAKGVWVLDACVLFPPLLREVLIGAARAGLYAPLWSERILEEWARAAGRVHGPESEARARGDAALLAAWFPSARVAGWESREALFALPDPADAHVAAAALAGGADGVVTLNLRDFPGPALAAEGLARLSPDAMLWRLWEPGGALDALLGRAVAGQDPASARKALKRAGLPRVAKAWAETQVRAR